MGEKDHLKIKIGNRLIGSGEPAYLIAEMSANHAGSIERAKEIIHAAKESGADCIKIQTYTPDTLTIDCHNKYFRGITVPGRARISTASTVRHTLRGSGSPS